ncbi:transglutaminase, partial [Streptococcus suis]
QLATDKERRVYLQFDNGLSKRMQVIDIESVNDEIYSRVYFYVAHDYQEFYLLTYEAAKSGGVDILDLE